MSNAFPSLSHTPQPFPLPSIAEDTLYYTLHVPTSESQDDTSALAILITEYVESLLIQPWLWNRDSWELKVISQAGDIDGGRLEGRMRVGDAVDDEWLVVYLLRQVSKRWPELIIGIRDTDGEFLLIEAANVLPSWVTPENSTNRLWLQNGNLHLIPLSIRSTPPKARQMPDVEDEDTFDPDAWISEGDALKAVRSGKYRAEELEKVVWTRIAGYPDALKTHLHHTKAWLPIPIAKALKASPELVQRAVEGFYVRDPSQLRAASRMTHFPPSPSVLSPVLLTRVAYAQLQGQVFHPPRIFGPEWHVAEGESEGENERRWRDLGVKISTGFEIMYREGGKRRGGMGNNTAEKDTAEYKTFLASLTKAGYFHGEMEGSAKWTEREAEAFKGWKSARSSDSAPERPAFAFQVDQAITNSAASPSDLEAGPSYKEDDESWLEVSPDDVDALLAERSGRGGKESDEAGPTLEEMTEGDERGQALSELAKKVESFVGGKGELEGATFADELSDEDMDDSDDEAEDTKEVREEKMRNLVAPLPAEEWGRKPSTGVKTGVNGFGRKVTIADSEEKPIKVRPPVFEPQEYDGVVYESDDDSDDEPARQGSLGQILGDMNWQSTKPKLEEVSDEEEDEDEEHEKAKRAKNIGLGEDIDEEMRKAVWGSDDKAEAEEDEDMGDDDIDFEAIMEEEQGDFLKFAQEALGITDDMMKGIVSSREARGAFVPSAKSSSETTPSTTASDKPSVKKESENTLKRPPVSNTPTPPAVEQKSGETNMSLDSFDKVMEAMDAELSKAKSSKRPKGPDAPDASKAKPQAAPAATKSTTKAAPLPKLPTEADLDDLDEDDLMAMDRELKAALKSAGIDSDDDDEEGIEEVGQLDDEGKREYRMMKDFLESYKSQGGNSGVVGNLFGRLGEKK